MIDVKDKIKEKLIKMGVNPTEEQIKKYNTK